MVALITGGSRGLGAEVARVLSRDGYRVAISYNRSIQQAAEVISGLEGPDAIALKADVADPAEVSRMAHIMERLWGRLDVLVNNAGISRDSLLARTSETDWDLTMKVNLRGSFNTVRALSGMLQRTGNARIINISSRSALTGRGGQAAYSASKSALIGLSLSMAREFASEGICVNTVLPGYMQTEMGNAAPGAMETARSRSLLGTLGSVKDVASFISWLAGTSSVTGQVFSIDSRIG